MCTLPKAAAASEPADGRFLPGSSRAARAALGASLLLALTVMAFHIRTYAFLCDDAFISFRYARNFAEGHGLVFNPGFERVEGYSNFLWVLALAAAHRIGIAPEQATLVLSWVASLALFALVAGFAMRHAPARGAAWAVLVPAVLLATNRSFAVWASSGLETRLFELFVIAGILRLCDEVAAATARKPSTHAPLRLISPWWFALAALTRPDGLLFSACALAAAAAWLAWRRALDLRRWAPALVPFFALVGAHFAFRRAYYGSWLPNTYYAKVGGRTWWDAGFEYLAAFALEYAVWLWVPFVIGGIAAWVRRGAGFVPFAFAAAVVPHALYVAAIGGDHFEYRPLDLYLPLVFLLMGTGAAQLAAPASTGDRADTAGPRSASRTRALFVACAVALVAWMAFELPWQSHIQFPARYLAGFPGERTSEPERAAFLDPARDPLHRTWGLRSFAAAHRGLLRTLSQRFIGVRAEEHARFLGTVAPEGRRLRALVEHGMLPTDTYIATGAVGAIPYYSGLRTLDRLGLTDAAIARSAPRRARVMAHDRSASFEEARTRGVDLWPVHDVHLLWRAGAPQVLDLVARRVNFHAAATGPDEFLLAMLPQGFARTSSRFPRLRFVPGTSSAFLSGWLERGAAVLRDSLDARDDDAVRRQLAYLLLLQRRMPEALREYERILAHAPEDPEQLLYASYCREALGQTVTAREELERARASATSRGDEPLAARIAQRLAELSAAR